MDSVVSKHSPAHRALNALVLLALGSIAIVAFERFWPLGADYYHHFRPLAEQWRDGYWHMFDGSREILLYPPWSMFVILPMGWFSLDLAKAILLVSTGLAIVWSLQVFYSNRSVPTLVLIFSLINLHTLDMFIRGQFDAFVLLGLAVAFWAYQARRPLLFSFALCLMTVKPPLMVMLPLMLFFVAARSWTWREKLAILICPTFCLLISAFAFGLDWPLNFINQIPTNPPLAYLSISLWRAADLIGLPSWPILLGAAVITLWYLRLCWKDGVSLRTLALGLSLTFVFTPYANGDHYVVLLPAFVHAVTVKWQYGVIGCLLTLLPLSRLWLGHNAAVFDIAYPVFLAFVAWQSSSSLPSSKLA